ncbi:MAG TPA: hypothetical protein VHE55_09390 [Fimbriimonadaceae bacterium]|nr:hypothetical protein [Fimbriimonadaceae bacterium]
MNSILLPPYSRESVRLEAIDLSGIWGDIMSASPRDQIEFGAKAFGFSGEAGSSADVPLGQASSSPGVVPLDPRPVSPAFASVDIIHVSRGAKTDWITIQVRKRLPPKGSIEWSNLAQKRIGYLSAGLALVTMWSWMLAVLREVPGPSRDWGIGLVAALLMLPALYALFIFLIDAIYGRISGATAIARKYMDQVYPPHRKG